MIDLFKSIQQIGLVPEASPYMAKTIRLVNTMSLVSIFTILSLFLVSIIVQWPLQANIFFLFLCAHGIGPLILNYYRRPLAARIFFIICGYICLLSFPILFGPETHFQYYLIAGMGMPLFFFEKEIGRWKFFLSGIAIIFWIYLEWHCTAFEPIISIDPDSIYPIRLLNNFMTFLFVLIVFYVFTTWSNRYAEEIENTSIKLEDVNVALNHSLYFQQKIMDTSPAVIYVYNLKQQKNVFANKSLSSELGYTEADIQAMGDQFFPQTIYPEDLEKVFHHHAQVLPNLEKDQTVKLSYRIRRNDTKEYIWLESTESMFEQDQRGKVESIIGIARNIHTQKQAELDIQEVNKDLEQLVYSVSHNLRAPVRHIESYSKWIEEKERNTLSQEGKQYLERVIYSARRLGNLIDGLLAYSSNRNTTPDKSWFDSHELVRDILEEFSTAHPQKDIAWEIQDLPKCFADPNMMRQIWENLISNAVKYSSKKEQTCIRIQAEDKQEDIIFSIHDNGCGFDPTYSDKLFAVFQSLHKRSEFPGNGIGLANVARMLQHHQGRIWAESIPGKGASFYFSIPQHKQHETTQKNHSG